MKKLVYLIVMLIFTSNLFAQHPEWAQYTCGKNATALVEDGDFIWIGTTGGLVKMNMTTQEMTFYNNANSGLPSNKITCLALDSNKNLWIGTYYDLTKYDGLVWTSYNDSNLFTYILDIEVDSNNTVWAGALGGLIKISNNLLNFYNKYNSDIPITTISSLFIDKENHLWIASELVNGCFMFDGNSWIKYMVPDSIFVYGTVASILVDNEGAILLSMHGGIVKYLNNVWKVYKSNAWIEIEHVYSLKMDQDGIIWAGGIDCFGRYDPKSDSWGSLLYNLDGFMNLKDLLPDNNGKIWLADENDGIAKFINKDSILYYNPSNSGLTHQTVTYIAIEDSIKWIANYSKGLIKHVMDNWIFSKEEYPLNFDIINYIAIDKESNKWIGTLDGIVKLDNNETLFWDSTDMGLPIGRVYSLDIDKNNNIWIASAWEGLFKFDGINWEVFDTSNSDIPSDELSCVAIDSKGNKWLGTYYGLVKFDNEIFIVYDSSNSDLPNNIINCIKIDENDVIWVGTENGLVRIEDSIWTVFNEFYNYYTGLPNNKISFIEKDRKGNIWIGFYNSGIARFDGSEWKFYNVSNSGLPDDYINCIAVDSSGKIWIATHGGIGVLDESVINVEENKLSVNSISITNFPNPFSENTKFRFNLVQPENVNLTIYNSLGQEIAVLCDEWKTEGEHEINFYGSDLNSGVYYYKFSVDSENHFGKVVLIR